MFLLENLSYPEGKPCVEVTQGKRRDILSDLQRLLSALTIHEGDLQIHKNWPQPSLGSLLFPHFGQSSHSIHDGSSFQTHPSPIPLLLEITPGPWPRGSGWPWRWDVPNLYIKATAGQHTQYEQSQVYFTDRPPVWNLTFPSLLTWPV